MDLTQLVTYAAAWHHLSIDCAIQETACTEAVHVAFDCGPRWEPWNNSCIHSVPFVERFRMSLADLIWLAGKLWDDLAQSSTGSHWMRPAA